MQPKHRNRLPGMLLLLLPMQPGTIHVHIPDITVDVSVSFALWLVSSISSRIVPNTADHRHRYLAAEAKSDAAYRSDSKLDDFTAHGLHLILQYMFYQYDFLFR